MLPNFQIFIEFFILNSNEFEFFFEFLEIKLRFFFKK